MSKGNFVDNLYVEDLNKFYFETGFCTVIEDGHAVSSFNENKFNKKAYKVMTDYSKERYKNSLVTEICE